MTQDEKKLAAHNWFCSLDELDSSIYMMKYNSNRATLSAIMIQWIWEKEHKKLRLADNIKKLENATKEVNALSNPEIYYGTNYPPQYKCDRDNVKRLGATLKSIERLTYVITKQTKERVKIMNAGFAIKIKIKQ